MNSTLGFDEIKMDTSLAEKFLQNIPEFKPIGFTGSKFGYNKNKNKIFYNLSSHQIDKEFPASNYDIEEIKLMLLKLSLEIEKNINLFCQLEYMIRNIPQKDIKDFDLKLIIQNLMFCATSRNRNVIKNRDIIMNDESPLVSLGYVPQVMLAETGRPVVIKCTIESAVVCHLFTKLCHGVGLKNVLLNIIDGAEPTDGVILDGVQELQRGCCGVVAGKCDLDSAVDTFLAATERFPWRVKRIFVQECVVKPFENAVAWKTKRYSEDSRSGAGDDPQQTDDVESKCSAVYSCEGKKFLFDYVGGDTPQDAITIEAYRTVKELLSLLKTTQPFCVSLWSSDVSEANEISSKIDATVIWVNDFGNFCGPSQSSQSFFSILDVGIAVDGPKDSGLIKLRNSWMGLSVAERVLRIGEIAKTLQIDAKDLLCNLSSDSFFGATNNGLCYGEQIALDFGSVTISSVTSVDELLFLVRGGGLVIRDSTQAQVFKEAGAPVVITEDAQNSPVSRSIVYKTRAIWSSYGTIFAN